MAINIWGGSGGYQGKNGGNIGRWLDGRNILGPLPHPTNIPPTVKLINARLKFRILTEFQRPIGSMIKVGFQNAKKRKQSSRNAAFALNYREAMTGVAPNFTIDYPKYQYSKGVLCEPYVPEVEATVAAELKFNWLADVLTDEGGSTDMATIVVYNPAKEKFVARSSAAMRSALTYNLLLPVDWSGDTVHCYMSFVAPDGEKVSDSKYLTSVSVL